MKQLNYDYANTNNITPFYEVTDNLSDVIKVTNWDYRDDNEGGHTDYSRMIFEGNDFFEYVEDAVNFYKEKFQKELDS